MSHLVHFFLQRLIWIMIRLLFSTLKVEYKNQHYFEEARQFHPKRVFVFALWHENVVSVMRGHAWTEPLLSMASRSKDGDYAAFVAQKLGFAPVRGSSKKRGKDKGGKEAAETYITKMNEGMSGGITIDGPKGPRRKCKQGVIFIAQQTQAMIVPVSGVANHYFEFNSWDRFKVPKPFSKITITYGAPLLVPKEVPLTELNVYSDMVTERLNQLDG